LRDPAWSRLEMNPGCRVHAIKARNILARARSQIKLWVIRVMRLRMPRSSGRISRASRPTSGQARHVLRFPVPERGAGRLRGELSLTANSVLEGALRWRCTTRRCASHRMDPGLPSAPERGLLRRREKRNEIPQMLMFDPRSPSWTRPTRGSTHRRAAVVSKGVTRSGPGVQRAHQYAPQQIPSSLTTST